MTDNEDDYKDDELINVKLSRIQYEVLKNVLAREQAYSWLKKALVSNWIWVVGGGIASLVLLYDRLSHTIPTIGIK